MPLTILLDGLVCALCSCGLFAFFRLRKVGKGITEQTHSQLSVRLRPSSQTSIVTYGIVLLSATWLLIVWGDTLLVPSSTSLVTGPNKLVEQGILTVGINTSFPLPAQDFLRGQSEDPHVEFDIEFVKTIAREKGLGLHFVSNTDQKLLTQLQNKQIDIALLAVYGTEDVTIQNVETYPYLKLGEALIVPKHTSQQISPSNLCGLSIAAQTASRAYQDLQHSADHCQKEQKKPLYIVSTQTAKAAIQSLHAQQPNVNAVLQDTFTASYYCNTSDKNVLQLSSLIPDEGQEVIVFHQNNSYLGDLVQEAYNRLKQQEKYQDILQQLGIDQ